MNINSVNSVGILIKSVMANFINYIERQNQKTGNPDCQARNIY